MHKSLTALFYHASFPVTVRDVLALYGASCTGIYALFFVLTGHTPWYYKC